MLSLGLPRSANRTGTRAAPRITPPGSGAKVDVALLWVVVGLSMLGLVMVFSASIALPDSPRFAAYKQTHFLVRHLFALALGTLAGLLAFAVPARMWQRLAPWLFVFGCVLLVLVLIPGVGKVVYGARRWLPLYVMNLQPSELMKLFVVLYAADYTVRKQDYMQSLKRGFLPMAAAVAAVGLLLLLEPDLGAFVVIGTIADGQCCTWAASTVDCSPVWS